MHSGLDHVRRENDRVALVGGHRGHDVGAAHGLGGTSAPNHGEIRDLQPREIADQLGRRARIGIVEPQLSNPHDLVKCNRLKFALRTIAYHRHHAARRACHAASCERRYRRGAQRRDEGHLREQQWIARRHVREHAESGDREQAPGRVLRMAVDVFERIQLAVAGRHEFDDAVGRVAGQARRFLELAPAPIVGLDLSGQFVDEPSGPDSRHQFPQARSSDVIHHDFPLERTA